MCSCVILFVRFKASLGRPRSMGASFSPRSSKRQHHCFTRTTSQPFILDRSYSLTLKLVISPKFSLGVALLRYTLGSPLKNMISFHFFFHSKSNAPLSHCAARCLSLSLSVVACDVRCRARRDAPCEAGLCRSARSPTKVSFLFFFVIKGRGGAVLAKKKLLRHTTL